MYINTITRSVYAQLLPIALRNAHPDHGGDAAALDQVLEARRRMDGHHKIKRSSKR